MHRIEPLGYMRDLLCLLPRWPKHRVLDVAPVNWTQTVAQTEVQQALAANAGGIPGAPPPGFTPHGIMGNLEQKMNRPDDLKHLAGYSLMGTDKTNRMPVAHAAAAELRKEGKDTFVFQSEMGTINAH